MNIKVYFNQPHPTRGMADLHFHNLLNSISVTSDDGRLYAMKSRLRLGNISAFTVGLEPGTASSAVTELSRLLPKRDNCVC